MLPPLSLSGADIEWVLRKLLRLCSVASNFLTSRGHVEIFLLLVPELPLPPNHIFGTTQNTLMSLCTATIHLTRNTDYQSVSRRAVSISSYPQVTQGTVYYMNSADLAEFG